MLNWTRTAWVSAFLTASAGAAQAQMPYWDYIAASTNSVGPGHTVAAPKDGKFYVIGQGTASGIATNQVFRINPLTQTPELVTPLPNFRCDSTAVTAPDGKIWVVGGREGLGHPPITATVVVYDPKSNTWTYSASLNTARVKPAVAVAGDLKIYAFGGTDGTYPVGAQINTVEVLDPMSPTPSWTTLAGSLPSGSSWRATAVHDGTGYLSSTTGLFKFPAPYALPLAAVPSPPFSGGANYSTTIATGQNGQLYNIDGFASVSNAYTVPGLTLIFNESSVPLVAYHNPPEATAVEGSIYAAGDNTIESYNSLRAKISGGTNLAFLPFDNWSAASVGCSAGTPGTATLSPTGGRVSGYASFPATFNFPGGPCFNVGSGNFSIDFWIRHQQPSGLASVLDYRDSTSRGYHVALYNGKVVLQMAIGSGQGQWANYVSMDAIPQGQWTHVALTVNRSVAPWKVYAWINGAYSGGWTLTQNWNLNSSLTSLPPMRIGGHMNGFNNLVGDLDEMRFYSKALTWHEVRSIFLAGQQGKKP